LGGWLIAFDRRLFLREEDSWLAATFWSFSDTDRPDECTSEARLKAEVKIARHLYFFGSTSMPFDGSWIRAAV
jgi:hypothetical protein